MAIRRRGRNSWEVTVELGEDAASGCRRRASVVVHGSKADAVRRQRALLNSRDAGDVVAPSGASKVTVAEFLDRWHRSYVLTQTRPRTAESYEVIIRVHLKPRLGRYRLVRLTPGAISEAEAAILASGRARRTVLHVHRVLSEALRYAVKWGLLSRNPADAVDPPKAPAAAIDPPDVEEVLALLDAARATPYHAAFQLLASTGARRGEVLGIRWRDVDLERGTCSIVQTVQRSKGQGIIIEPPKSARGHRLIALDARTVEVLRAHRALQLEHRLLVGAAYKDRDFVFAGAVGDPLDPSVLTRTFGKLLRRARLRHFRLHDLRHFHATLLLKEGTHPKVVQERLGHASISVTLDTYSHTVPSLQEAAALAFGETMEAATRRRDEERRRSELN